MLSFMKREEMVPDEDGCMVNDSDTAWVRHTPASTRARSRAACGRTIANLFF
jgi:hypothetical protein